MTFRRLASVKAVPTWPHGTDCAICAVVDRYFANRRPTPRRGSQSELAGLGAVSRHEAAALGGSPDRPLPPEARPG